MKPTTTSLIVAIYINILACNLICSTAESILGNENTLSSLEFCLNDMNLNENQISSLKLVDFEKHIKSKFELISRTDEHYHDYSIALGAIDDLLELVKLRDARRCNIKALGIMGQYAGFLLDTLNRGDHSHKKIDAIVHKLLEEQVWGVCEYMEMQDLLVVRLLAVERKPTILDRLKKSHTELFLQPNIAGYKVRTDQWPAIFYKLAGEKFPSAFESNWQRVFSKGSSGSLKKFVKFYDSELVPLCRNYSLHGMGLFVRLAPYIKLFLPDRYDFKHDMPKLFRELPNDLDKRDMELLFGWITNETFDNLKRSYYLCAELVALDRKELEKIFKSILAWPGPEDKEEF